MRLHFIKGDDGYVFNGQGVLSPAEAFQVASWLLCRLTEDGHNIVELAREGRVSA